MGSALGFFVFILYLVTSFGSSLPFHSLIGIILILLWNFFVIVSKTSITYLHIWFFILATFYFFNALLNNVTDFGSTLGIMCVPFLFYSLIRSRPINKIPRALLVTPAIIIIFVFSTYVLFNAFPMPTYEVSSKPTALLQMIFTQTSVGVTREFRSSNALGLILSSFPFLLLSLKSKGIIRLCFIPFFLTMVYTTKVLAIIISIVFIGCYSLNLKYHKYLFWSIISLIIFYPFIMKSSFIINKFSDKNFDLLLSGRGRIWFSAIKMWTENTSNLWFGIGDRPLIIKNFFSDGFREISYHSGLLRLLVQNGIIFYFLSLGSLIYLFLNSYQRSAEKIKKVFMAFSASLFVLNISDSSLFYSFGYITAIVIPIGIIFNLNTREINFRNKYFPQYHRLN
jgi:hypothetical protein